MIGQAENRDSKQGTDGSDLESRFSALLLQVASERQAFSEVRQSIDNLRLDAVSAIKSVEDAKQLAPRIEQLQLALVSAELRLSAIETSIGRVAAALTALDGQIHQQQATISGQQHLIMEFLSVVKHPAVVKLLRGASKLKSRLRLTNRQG